MKELKVNLGSIGYLASELTRLIQSTGKDYRVSIKEYKASRSLNQNALFHKWCGELSVYLLKKGRADASPEFCKELLKHTFLGYEAKVMTNAKTGCKSQIESLKHTSKLDTGEMKYFMDEVYAWCVGIGLLLTIPEFSEYKKLGGYDG